MKTTGAASAVVLLAAACGCARAQNSTTVTTAASTTASGTPTEPCAVVSSSWAAQRQQVATPTVEASIVYECLQSVPINQNSAVKFIDSMSPYIEWQSDAAFKKNPPADYFYPAYDMWAEIDRIRTGLAAGNYSNEYAWQADLYVNVFGQAHDGHFVVYTDFLTTAVEWARPWALVSVSEDGSSAPVVKVYGDIVSAPGSASVVSQINGEDAVEYIKSWIFQASSNQDADSAYNSMFFSKAYNQSGTTGYFQMGGRVRYIYPGANTTLTFENGTEVVLPNVARLKGDWSGVVSGPTYFSKFCPVAAADTATATATASTATATATVTASSSAATVTAAAVAAAADSVPGYPDPVVVSSDNIVSGYLLDGEGFEDVAVLVMTSFSPDSPAEFQETVQTFLADAVAAGATKLVVDVQANGGGYILQGYDTFRQLFPDVVQNGTGRWRRSSGFAAVAEAFSGACADFDPNTGDEELIYVCESVWNWRYDLDLNNENFTSFDDKFGPLVYNSDNFTDVMQWNLSNPLDTSNATYGIGYDVTGYGSRTNFTRPFGGPENIVLLLDGYCASTCTLFSQFLKWDAGVKSIAMGGRPDQVGVIQGVGGVKGAQSFSYGSVFDEMQKAVDRTDDPDVIAEIERYSIYAINRANTASLNVKDEILPTDLGDGTPGKQNPPLPPFGYSPPNLTIIHVLTTHSLACSPVHRRVCRLPALLDRGDAHGHHGAVEGGGHGGLQRGRLRRRQHQLDGRGQARHGTHTAPQPPDIPPAQEGGQRAGEPAEPGRHRGLGQHHDAPAHGGGGLGGLYIIVVFKRYPLWFLRNYYIR